MSFKRFLTRLFLSNKQYFNTSAKLFLNRWQIIFNEVLGYFLRQSDDRELKLKNK